MAATDTGSADRLWSIKEGEGSGTGRKRGLTRGLAGDGAREGGRNGGGGGGRLAVALRSEKDDAGRRECMLESEGSRSCSIAGRSRGLGGTARCGWLPEAGGLSELVDAAEESAASFSNLERRLLTAGGAAVSIPSDGSGAVMAASEEDSES